MSRDRLLIFPVTDLQAPIDSSARILELCQLYHLHSFGNRIRVSFLSTIWLSELTLGRGSYRIADITTRSDELSAHYRLLSFREHLLFRLKSSTDNAFLGRIHELCCSSDLDATSHHLRRLSILRHAPDRPSTHAARIGNLLVRPSSFLVLLSGSVRRYVAHCCAHRQLVAHSPGDRIFPSARRIGRCGR